jgi:hypothetical protein
MVSMEVVFGFKGQTGKIEDRVTYNFDVQTMEKLKQDFETYLNGIPSQTRGVIKGGCYSCTKGQSQEPIYLCVKFEEIVYIG